MKYIKKEMALLKSQEEYKEYATSPWYKKMFREEPQLMKGTFLDFFKEDMKEFPDYYRTNGGEYVSVNVTYNSDTMYPVLIYQALRNGCFYQSRIAYNENGSYIEWGIAYPYSECGVTGLLSKFFASLTDDEREAENVYNYYKAKLTKWILE